MLAMDNHESATADTLGKLLSVSPRVLTSSAILHASLIETPLGQMLAVTDQSHLHLLEFVDRKALPSELRKLQQLAKGRLGVARTPVAEQVSAQLDNYFARQLDQFDIPLALHGTPFTKSVWRALMQIPCGETRSYADLARQVGRPDAVRAVGRANGANQIAILIPCHRILGSDGSLTGYGGGLWRKQRLLDIETQIKRPG